MELLHEVKPVEHSERGPSGAPRWINCPGSVEASRGQADKESVFAAEGTAAHYVADYCFQKGITADKFIGVTIRTGGHDFKVDPEWADAIQDYLDWCDEVPVDVSVSETKVSYERWVPGGFGWVDRAMFKGSLCTIRDLKFGKGVQVFAKENEQLMMQAIGMLEEYPFDDIEEFELGIAQPRLDHKDTWRVSKADLLKWAEDTIPPVLRSSKFLAGDWCQFCRFKPKCAVRANVGLTNIFGNLDEVGGTTPVPVEMTPARRVQILPLIGVIKSWISDFEKGAVLDIISGLDVGGWKLVEGRSNRKFTDGDKVVSRVGPDLAFEKKLQSPSKLEKLMGKAKFVKLLGDLVDKPPGKPKLAPPEDPRPAMSNVSNAQFTDIDEE
jgi:Protein of unknown function (DUF2800)